MITQEESSKDLPFRKDHTPTMHGKGRRHKRSLVTLRRGKMAPAGLKERTNPSSMFKSIFIPTPRTLVINIGLKLGSAISDKQSAVKVTSQEHLVSSTEVSQRLLGCCQVNFIQTTKSRPMPCSVMENTGPC
jgi:hypothetical protein